MKFRNLAIAMISLAMMQAGWSLPAAAATRAAASGSEGTATKTVKKSSKRSVSAPAKKSVKKRVSRKAAAHHHQARRVKVSLRHDAAAHDAAVNSAPLQLDAAGLPHLRSTAFLVMNQNTGHVILEKKSDSVLPIASITKLMTAMVVLDGGQSLAEEITISEGDIDTLKGTGSRLSLGTRLSREEMLHLALMSSENRAASSLARHYPGGEAAFVAAMNVKARMIGLTDTHFSDPTGLTPANVSSPHDLARMVSAASTYPLIREFSTTSERYVQIGSRVHRFGNTNSLVRSPDWEIGVQKTGYIREAGRCLVMQAWLMSQPVIFVLMDSEGRYSRTADAVRIKKWLEAAGPQRLAVATGKENI
ncbi:serine hydrolase [Azoarcus sp. DN11]|uniref:serine hydrolase n=1 Tax=Azoarcus sp. DN11 TaxID=356837 RepID=UPI000EB3F212|nr:serine hydrolase [Azoarcus sp. DN11]AYH42316.1 peptidase S11 [Azoarcus sp. DN11]